MVYHGIPWYTIVNYDMKTMVYLYEIELGCTIVQGI